METRRRGVTSTEDFRDQVLHLATIERRPEDWGPDARLWRSMTFSKSTRFLGAVALTLPLVVSCASKPAPPAQPVAPQVKYPEWVNKGSGSYNDGALYGVASASGIRNRGLARSTADNRARAEMSKVMETYTASLMKDYMSSTSAGDAVSEEQHVESAIKTFSASTLNGVQIVNHWTHPVDGTIFALARLDMHQFSDQISRAKELSAKVKERVKHAAKKAIADLEAEEAKHASK